MDSFDVSIGLTLTLQLLEQYQQSGTLQTKIEHVPGISGVCMASIQIAMGKVISCTLEGRNGQRQSTGISALTRLDNQYGTLEWSFHAQTEQQSKPIPPQIEQQLSPISPQIEQQLSPISPQNQHHLPLPRRLSTRTVPHAIARLSLDWLTTWSPRQKRTLYRVYSLIDGRRTVEEIEMIVAFPPRLVQESLIILMAMQVIVIKT